MAVAQSSSGVVAICYVLPVLWMTSCFSYNGPYSGMNFTTKGNFVVKAHTFDYFEITRKLKRGTEKFYG